MTPYKASVVLERKFVCPCCNDYKFLYSHLIQPACISELRPSYTWNCDNCVSDITFSVDPVEFSVTIMDTVTPPKGQAKMLVLLELNTGDVCLKKPVYIVVEHSNYNTRGKGYASDLVKIAVWLKYYYEVHTCPTNYLDVVDVIEGLNDDPHGIFQFREVIWKPEGFNDTDFHNSGRDWSELFPSMRDE